MKLGFLYAGQGAQAVGMGKDFYDADATFKALYDGLNVGFDVKKISFEGPEEVLNETKYTQPCMVAFQVGVTEILKSKGIVPAMSAGLSLGEYSALYSAGVFEASQVISLVSYRGEVMAKAAEGRDCKMIAVLGLSQDQVKEGCAKVAEKFAGTGLVAEPANYNMPGQITVSGDTEAVDYAAEVMKELGAKRCLPVKVSGPFHTSLMKPAGDALKERFATENFGEMTLPVVFNCFGAEKKAEDSIPEILEKQVQSSVYFEDSLLAMQDAGVEAFVEIGPGNTLSKFAKKTCPGIPCYNVQTPEDVDALLAALNN